MEMYRLKKEAVPFFNEKMATQILDLDQWEKYKIDINALEKVEPVRLEYGQKDAIYTHLSGWSHDDGSRFHFTIYYPSAQYRDHDIFSKGNMIRELMDEIQRIINNHYRDYLEKQ